MIVSKADYVVEPWNEMSTPCDCCGQVTRSICGIVNREEATVAAYWIRWTEAHLAANGADFGFVIGRWGDDTTKEDRLAVKMVYSPQDEGPGWVMVVDAPMTLYAEADLTSRGLRRDEIIGTPLAPMIFALFDAIWEQDQRLFRGDRIDEV